jgi:glycosyltransferase involved in cell wall biosynthesis
MTPTISVLVSTHNPHEGRLRRTLDALFCQTLDAAQWELVVIDNRSTPPLNAQALGLQRYSHASLAQEGRLGLIHGRVAGINNSSGELVVFCDDDNVLAHDFLARAVAIFAADPALGNASGKILPEFEVAPAPWVAEFGRCFALRDFGDRVCIGHGATESYPDFAFGGGGAVFRRAALSSFVESIASGRKAEIVGRAGSSLDSGEDNHLILTVMKEGYAFGYFPELAMTHLIPAGRLTREYLGRLNHAIRRSWIQVLALHGICPWSSVAPWTVPLRKGRAYLRYRPWAGPAEYVRWRGACGHFDGLAALHTQRSS